VTRRLPLVLGASIAALALAPLAGTANAGRFGGGGHFGGGAHFSGGAHFGGGVHFSGAHFAGGVHVGGYSAGTWGGGVHVGYRAGWGGYHGWGGYGWHARGHVWWGGYYPYYWGWGWPYYGYYYPSYETAYVGSYYPADTTYTTPGVTAIVAPPPPPLPKLGVGVFGGMVNTDYNTATNTSENDLGLLARYRITDGLIVEGELGRVTTSVKNPDGSTTDNARVDRRLGGTLIWEIGARNRLAPYVLGGLGVQQASVNGDYNTTQDYAEIGAGLRLALTPHLHIAFDVRAGQLSSVSNDSPSMLPPNTTASMVAPPPSSSSNNSEDYTRARLSAILYF
jgi:hypothetical protein